jgi:lysozyme
MKGGKIPFSIDLGFTSIPAPEPSRPTVAGPIPDITIQGIPRPRGPFERTYTPKDMSYTEELVTFVKRAGHEGPFEPKPYADPANTRTPTIGYGHRLYGSYDPNMIWTEEQGDRVLRRDLDQALDRVRSKVSAPVTQSQLNALVSLFMNMGGNNFDKSQAYKKLHAGDYVGAATELLTFDNAGGVPLRGLTERRRLEAKMFAGAYAHLLPPDRPKTK